MEMHDVPLENDEPVLKTEVRDNVFVMILNRPQARHAFNLALATALSNALDRLDADPALLVGVLTGAGGTFSSGADLKALRNGERSFTKERGGFGIMKRPPDKPLIAAIEGYAVAGGFELALCADLIVAARDAKFGLPEVKRGLVAVGGALFRLPRRIPYHAAMEMALTGDLYPAERMQELGLVNRVVDPGAALESSLELATKLSANAPLALRATKQILARSNEWTDESGWVQQRRYSDAALASEDAKEGPRAFAEKRNPRWQAK